MNLICIKENEVALFYNSLLIFYDYKKKIELKSLTVDIEDIKKITPDLIAISHKGVINLLDINKRSIINSGWF